MIECLGESPFTCHPPGRILYRTITFMDIALMAIGPKVLSPADIVNSLDWLPKRKARE